MQHVINRTLFDYWNTVRGQRVAPRRFEIEPSRIADILADTFILERVDRGVYRYRLAGTRLCESFSAEFRGANFLDGWAAADRDRLQDVFADVTRRGAAGLLTVEQVDGAGVARRFEFMILPLLHTGQTIDRYLGAAALVHGPAEPPIGAPSARRLIAADMLTPEALGLIRAADAQPARPTPLSVLVRSARIVRHNRRQFRVYDGGLSTPVHPKAP
ncbi:MAG: PAS domain-containing protein [Hyphomicrobiaceae bacterium]|nr:PAS domain-containing protein [Hyphomicrobiaceae bacterium]